jgi:probable rRNA maturation factor
VSAGPSRAGAGGAVAPRETRRIVAVTSEGARAAIGRDAVQDLVRGVLRAERVARALISVTFLAPAAMAAMNRRHLGHRGPTDVISFGFAPGGVDGVVGDVYVCPAVASAHATVFGCGVREETARLVVHGTLHVLGWDHPVDGARERSPMWVRQEALVRRLWTRRV